MALSLTQAAPVVPADPEVSFTSWTEAVAPRFFVVWEAAFQERPGFPGWRAQEWISWISDDEDFRTDWTLLAHAGGGDLGFGRAHEAAGSSRQVSSRRRAGGASPGR